MDSCGADIAIAPESHLGFLRQAVERLDLVKYGLPSDFESLPEIEAPLEPLQLKEIAYLNASGSTRFPRGVEISQKCVMSNLSDLRESRT